MNELARFLDDPGLRFNRRHFFSRTSLGLGGAALASLLNEPGRRARAGPDRHADPITAQSRQRSIRPRGASSKAFDVAPRARRIIYLFMSGGPSQLDLFDYKPLLNEMNGQDLPESVRKGQRLTGMSANQATLPMAGSIFKFGRHGQSGAWVSELLPHTAGVVDELCLITSLYTEAINHDPAITFFQTGSSIAGPAVDGIVAQLWPGIRQSEPADVLRLDQPQASRPAALFPALGQRLFAVGTPGRAVSGRGRSGPLPGKSARRQRRPAAARCSTGCANCTRPNTTRRSTRRSRPGSHSMRWLIECKPRCPR